MDEGAGSPAFDVGDEPGSELAELSHVVASQESRESILQRLVETACTVLEGCAAASVTLVDRGRATTAVATNDAARDVDQAQYDTGEGPCLDAAIQGERFHIDSLGEESRWPAFVPRARARGIESILSTPLVAGEGPIGALNVYSRTIGAFAVHEKEWADQFAAEAASVVSSANLSAPVRDMSAQIRRALISREVIALAQGMIMQRDGATPAAAHAQLMDTSRRTGRRLLDVSDDLVRNSGAAADVSAPTVRTADARTTH